MTAPDVGYDLPPLLPTDVRDEFCAWIESNGVDPTMVVGGTPVRIQDQTITVREFQSDRRGPGIERAVPMLMPLPDRLAQDLRELRYEC